MSQIKRILFPFGIFFLLSLLFAGSAVTALSGLYYVTLKRTINDFERNTQQYLVPLLDSSVQMASLDGGTKSAERLNLLFNGYRSSGIVYKAFFVKEDGTIFSHSSASEAKELKYNIASDEFTYNLDQIFLPLKKDIKEPLFADYFLVDKNIPFNKQQMRYLKKYINDGLDRNGWILTRKVDYKGKAAGVVVFLVDKELMYDSIHAACTSAIFRIKIGGMAAVGCAFLFSLIIFIRYHMMYSKGMRDSVPSVHEASPFEERQIALPGDAGYVALPPAVHADSPETFPDSPQTFIEYGIQNRNHPAQNTLVQDAIPVRKKMH